MRRSAPPGHGGRALLTVVLALLAMCGTALAAGSRTPDPAVHIPLDPLGYQTLQSGYLLSGGSMMTVNFADDTHLLITFTLRRLLVREPDTPNDQDRTIGAFLVELPTGKVVAQTEWRVHDIGQYLWSIGHGRFLLRIRDQLTMIEPARAGADDAFQQQPFLNVKRQIVALLVSPNDDLLTIESADPPEKGLDGVELARNGAPIQLNFYRLKDSEIPGTSQARLTVVFAGILRAHGAIALPVTAAGYLEVVDDGKNRFGFNYNSHAGKVSELAGIETTCFPRPVWVSESEFVAFGCHGSQDKQVMEAFNLKGEALWQLGFNDSYVGPQFVFAPGGGRFALSRTIVTGNFDSSMQLSPEMVTGQDVRVFQTYSGKQLFRIDCSPVQRAGQNFDLSPDGTKLAVYRDTLRHVSATKDEEAYTMHSVAVEVYAMPELSKEDVAAVKVARSAAPPQNDAQIELAARPASAPAGAASASASAAPAKPASASAAAANSSDSAPASAAPAADVTPQSAQGDVPPDAPRKPPSLYGPDETPPNKPQ